MNTPQPRRARRRKPTREDDAVSATPRVSATVADSLLAWSPTGVPVLLDQLSATLLTCFDEGPLSAGELADDLSVTFEIDRADAVQSALASVRQLQKAGLLTRPDDEETSDAKKPIRVAYPKLPSL